MYRGDTLFKVRYGEYKAHFYTWGTPLDAQHLVSDIIIITGLNHASNDRI